MLTLKRTGDLKPHEETVQEELDAIIGALRNEPVLRHPIIADSNSGAVLDGTHRLAALRQLECLAIPAALIDYQNPLVQVERWFRIIKGQSLRDFIRGVDGLSPTPMSVSEAEDSLSARSSYATLRDARECFAFKSEGSSPLDLCKRAFALEQLAKESQAKIALTDNGSMHDLSESTILMSTIRLDKREVVENCLKHLLFPPKSTRHLIPSRPLGVAVPIEWLKNTDSAEAEEKFERHLRAMTMRRLSAGSKVGSRRYMEEVFLFE